MIESTEVLVVARLTMAATLLVPLVVAGLLVTRAVVIHRADAREEALRARLTRVNLLESRIRPGRRVID